MRADRQRRILELVAQQGQVTVADICETFHVSEMTARRDLRDLSRDGALRRVHGGALTSLGRGFEPPYQVRAGESPRLKQAIGHAAAAMIRDGESVAFDVGTTTLEVVRALQGRRHITIVTSSFPLASEVINRFSLNTDVRLIITGGVVRSGELSMIGHYAERVYNDLHVDKAFLGIAGISLKDGLTEYNLDDALVKRAMIRSAQRVILVADSTKFDRTTFTYVAALSDVHAIVTDADAPRDMVDALQRTGIDVTLA